MGGGGGVLWCHVRPKNAGNGPKIKDYHVSKTKKSNIMSNSAVMDANPYPRKIRRYLKWSNT